jgi:UDP-glucose 4-epimerase
MFFKIISWIKIIYTCDQKDSFNEHWFGYKDRRIRPCKVNLMREVGVLVTGGAGFIGSNLVDLLMENGYTVYVMDDLSTGSLRNLDRWVDESNFKFISGDIRHPLDNILTPSNIGGGPPIGIIFHLAARVDVTTSFQNPREDMEVNYLGTLNVLEYANRMDVKKVIFSSSAAVYGDTETFPITEDLPLNPLSPYGLNKMASEKLLEVYKMQYGLDHTILRFFNVYGPRQDPKNHYSGVISKFMEWGLMNKPLMIHGDGGQTRDFIYVEDVAEAMLRASGSDYTGTINVATGIETSILDMASVTEDVSSSHLKRIHLPERKGEIRRSVADTTKLQEKLGAMDTLSLREGMRKTYRWFETQPDRVVN